MERHQADEEENCGKENEPRKGRHRGRGTPPSHLERVEMASTRVSSPLIEHFA
jgi:hypothetical protein